MAVPLRSLVSSHLLAAGYDPASRTLSVQFEGGAIYEYYDVPPSIYEEMLSAQPHPWTAVNRKLRESHEYRRRS
ncbi:KTSC domain-containing protein [Actinomadura sp. DC4]|uniref:KTSC domain-containing protein n=1 Tax=Actinomadura sp. DC4 TaxID=3055069 RepID=UPI00339D437F